MDYWMGILAIASNSHWSWWSKVQSRKSPTWMLLRINPECFLHGWQNGEPLISLQVEWANVPSIYLRKEE
jgi:hypothetical protein